MSDQEIAEKYHDRIWQVFYIGVGISLTILYLLWNNKDLERTIQIALLGIGFLILTYSTIVIEQFSQVMIKLETYRIKMIKKSLPYLKARWWAEFILSLIFILYGISAYKKFPEYGSFFITVLGIFYILILTNWYGRINENGEKLVPFLTRIFTDLLLLIGILLGFSIIYWVFTYA